MLVHHHKKRLLHEELNQAYIEEELFLKQKIVLCGCNRVTETWNTYMLLQKQTKLKYSHLYSRWGRRDSERSECFAKVAETCFQKLYK